MQSTAKKIINDNKKTIRMHKFDNFEELQSISSNIKIQYNHIVPEYIKNTEKAIVIDINYMISSLKSASALKQSDK